MSSPSRARLRSLATAEASPCVSIFLAAGGELHADRQGAPRLEKLLRRAVEELHQRGLGATEARELLAPAWALADDPTFWVAPAGGVALYAAPGFFQRFRVDHALPDALRIGERFSLRPLLPWVDQPERFLVLAVSLKRVRLVEATADGFHEVRLADLPSSFQAAMGYVDYDTDLSAHTASPAALGRRGLIAHGSGNREKLAADLEHFCRRVVAPVERALALRPAPVVLACVDEHVPYLRRAAESLELLDETIRGNPDHRSDAELVTSARERVGRSLARAVRGELARWTELRGSGRASDELETIVRAADEGRVEALFVAQEAELWGKYEPELGRVIVHTPPEAGDVELLDFALSRTLARHGEAHALPLAAMPEGRAAVAIVRWAEAA